MKDLLPAGILVLAFSGSAFADPIALEIVPDSFSVVAGDIVTADVRISGLGVMTPPTVGAFDLSVGFDPAFLDPFDVSFGPFLGNPADFEALTDFTFGTDFVEAAEVSLLSVADLDARHPSSFTLFTLSFRALMSGTTSLGFNVGVVDDPFGNKLAQVPEPGTFVLLGSGLAGIVRLWRRRIFAGHRFKAGVRRVTILATCGIVVYELGVNQASAVDFQKIDALGIEYKTEIKVSSKARLMADGTNKVAEYQFFEVKVTLNNSENKDKNLVICTFGYSKKFNETDDAGQPVSFRRTQIDMTFAGDSKTLGCMLSQKQEEMKHTRIGQLGCRQVTLAANQMGLSVTFVSGNKRTTIKKVDANIAIDQMGPVQDGQKNADKIIAAGGVGAGGHPRITTHEVGAGADAKRIRISDSLGDFFTRIMLSDDAEVKLDTDATKFTCNRCFGMGSTLGDPAATRTDFLLNLPSAAIKQQAKLKVSNQIDAAKVLLVAGGRTQGQFELVNESDATVQATFTPTLLDVPAPCTATIQLPEPQPISLPPLESKTATIQFDCTSDLSDNASADAIFALNDAGSGDVLGNYWIKARNPLTCDVNLDGQVDIDDIDLIMSYRETPANGPDDPFDVDGDGVITVNDARACVNQCTHDFCVP